MENRILVKKYKLLEPIATGGMATVYLAKNMATDEIIVAKIPNFAGLPNREKLEKRFLREAQILSKIDSKYVVRIHDYGKDEMSGDYFLILEYLHGKTLEEIVLDSERLPVPTVIDLTLQLASVLKDLHSQGIVHRDIKSSNVKITSEGNIKLFDFGISKGQDMPAMTRSSDFLGTIQYMSPEQTDGRDVDIRSDIYSLGIVLYEMLFGELPFDAPSPVELIEMQRKRKPRIPPEAKERDIPSSLLSLMLRCLQKDPLDRYQTPDELISALNVVAESTGMSAHERDRLRRTRFTQVTTHKPPVPTYQKRQKQRKVAVISTVAALLVAIGGGLFLWKGCETAKEPDYMIAQGEQIEEVIPLTVPPGYEQIVASTSEVPPGLIVDITQSDEDKNLWVLNAFSKFTTPSVYILSTYRSITKEQTVEVIVR